MKVWTCTNFKGHWPVGTAAVILASTEGEALHLLDEAVQKRGLPPLNETCEMVEVTMQAPRAVILCDGNY